MQIHAYHTLVFFKNKKSVGIAIIIEHVDNIFVIGDDPSEVQP